MTKEIEPRDVTDFVNNSILRLKDEIEILEYLEQNAERLIGDREFLLHYIDLLSRDTVNVLANVLDEDDRVSSMFALTSLIQEEYKKKEVLARLWAMKSDCEKVLVARYNITGHFNTKFNSVDHHKLPINIPVLMDSAFLKKRFEPIEELFWELKEYLKIDGIFNIYCGNPIANLKSLLGEADDVK